MSSLLSIILLLLVIPIHELGHYIFAKIFSWNPKFGSSKKGFCVIYYPNKINGNEKKLILTSFFGVIGIIPFFAYCVFSNLLLNELPIIIFLFAYSLFEMLCRWRKLRKR